MVYRKLFYLIAVMSTQKHRTRRLTDEGLTSPQIEKVIRRDRKEAIPHGQKLEKTFKLADYFMHNPLGEEKLIPDQLKRFFDLVHGHNGTAPTKHEHAMYIAHAAAMRSSCMSRQVGAVITDKADRIIAVGTNDVPQYGGGLYTGEGEQDDRCFKNRRVCENDAEKGRRKARIKAGIVKELPTIFDSSELQDAASQKIDALVDLVFTQSGIPDLIEFSRAVHAEMDALISLSRSGGGSTVGGNLYTTTFPCHNCARHIVAAGLEKVFYIEPYEKSLAPEAHNDSIEVLAHDDQSGTQGDPLKKVKFVHFSGVGPRLYAQLFLRNDGRKDDSGKFIECSTSPDGHPPRIIQEYIDSYRIFEAKIASMFDKEFPTDVIRSVGS
jgi:deoxycytidylate deaminase